MALPADFSKIYGSTATGGLTPINDVNYAKGWEFVGSNPPTKNDFSYLQNLSDQKSQWLYDNKLQRTDPFGDIKSDGTVSQALSNLGLENIVGNHIGQTFWHDMRTKMLDGCVAGDGQQVDQVGPFADLYADAAAGNRPTCTEAEWQADPTKRGCYVLDSAPGKMRLPDLNGVQPGSIKAPVMRGDGGTLAAGSAQKGGVPNVAGSIDGSSKNTYLVYDEAIVKPPFKVLPQLQKPLANTLTGDASGSVGRPLGIDLSTSSDAYVPGLTEVRANSIVGCFVIRYAGRSQNAGTLDAMTLSARMESINTDLLAKNAATNARISMATLTVTNPALGTRTTIANPFGNSTPVICVAEILHAPTQKWVSSKWIWNASGNATYGVEAFYSEGEGIVLVTGKYAYLINTNASNGAPIDTGSADYTTPSPVRIRVTKVAP